MSPIWLVAIPGVVAVGLWALVDLERFLLFAVLCTIVYPTAIVQPGGTQVALADLLLLAVCAAWLIRNSMRVAPDPYVTGNRLLVPALIFTGVNAASLAWSDDPHKTLIFTL